MAASWGLAEAFRRWLGEDCLWINSLVDRIVSEPLEPAGAVAEPYALWAVENRPGLVMPCRHPSVVVTDDLKRYERLKLFILNLGHTYLAEGGRRAAARRTKPCARCSPTPRRSPTSTTSMIARCCRCSTGSAWAKRRAPIARRSIERFRNPFLDHYLADIFTNHAAKKQRRFGGLDRLGRAARVAVAQPRLKAALAA